MFISVCMSPQNLLSQTPSVVVCTYSLMHNRQPAQSMSWKAVVHEVPPSGCVATWPVLTCAALHSLSFGSSSYYLPHICAVDIRDEKPTTFPLSLFSEPHIPWLKLQNQGKSCSYSPCRDGETGVQGKADYSSHCPSAVSVSEKGRSKLYLSGFRS